MAPEMLTQIFPHKESNYSRRNSTALHRRRNKTVISGKKFYLAWDQKYETFYRWN